ncbi:hypothetical protein N7535_003654 [Penicillium sp. DV-2018c]|nr:hypothetical protein N7535_003654 [Penicillium sp. DV-2018c]
MRKGLDLPEFGYLPFDHFAVDWFLATLDDPIIDHVPDDVPHGLLSESGRSISSLLFTVLWIRTWFGDPTDKTSREAADTAYARLRKEVLQQGVENNHVDCIPEEFVFEDREELEADAQRDQDVIEGVATGRPLFEGMSDVDWRHFEGEERAEELAESERAQNALVLVADRKACEGGWVLALAVNHRGKILPVRVRERATEAAQIAVNWFEGGPLAEILDDDDDDVEFYIGGGNGWRGSSYE